MLLHSSSPSCSTPSHSSYYSARSHKPVNSSPLASPSCSSPTHHVHERRRAQYKSTTPASHRSPALQTSAQLLFRRGIQTPADPQKAFLRDRLQAQCRQHAQNLRERAVSSRRSSDKCSDVFMDCDDESDESDDAVMQDELFRRIIQSTNNKMKHSYRVSYALEVGSSFDPDVDDARAWENELQEHTSSGTELTPDDLEDEELRDYAERYTVLADFADLDNVDFINDDWAALSDADVLDLSHQMSQPQMRETSDMDVS